MSRYSLEYCTDRELPEWLVIEERYTARQVTIGAVVFKSSSEEEAQAMLEEFRICEMAEEYNRYADQLTEFDYV